MLDRTKAPPAGSDSDVARADVDEEHAAKRRGPHRLRKARSAARLVLDHVLGGADQFEPAGREGVAVVDRRACCSEGTKTKDGEALSNALQLLGTTVNANVAGETGTISFVSTTAKFGADTRHPRGHAPQLDVSRRRGSSGFAAQRLVALTQARAQPAAIASRVFPRIVFGSDHPYGRMVTEQSLKAITRDDVVAFHKAYFQPAAR